MWSGQVTNAGIGTFAPGGVGYGRDRPIPHGLEGKGRAFCPVSRIGTDTGKTEFPLTPARVESRRRTSSDGGPSPSAFPGSGPTGLAQVPTDNVLYEATSYCIGLSLRAGITCSRYKDLLRFAILPCSFGATACIDIAIAEVVHRGINWYFRAL